MGKMLEQHKAQRLHEPLFVKSTGCLVKLLLCILSKINVVVDGSVFEIFDTGLGLTIGPLGHFDVRLAGSLVCLAVMLLVVCLTFEHVFKSLHV